MFDWLFQKPEPEGHEGNEGHEELLVRIDRSVLVRDPGWRLSFLRAKGEGQEGNEGQEERQINDDSLDRHLGAESLAPRPTRKAVAVALSSARSRCIR